MLTTLLISMMGSYTARASNTLAQSVQKKPKGLLLTLNKTKFITDAYEPRPESLKGTFLNISAQIVDVVHIHTICSDLH